MLKTFSIICLILLCSGPVLALELGGIQLGGSLESALTTYPDAKCEEKARDQVFDKKCGVSGKVAGKEVALVFQSKEGVVGSINAIFNPADYDSILLDLTKDNGNPGKSGEGFALWGSGNSKVVISLEKNSRNIPNAGLLMLMDLKFTRQGS